MALVAAVGLLLTTAGCGSTETEAAGGVGSAGAETPPGNGTGTGAESELRVLAAASLTDVMTDLAKAFEADHPDHRVTLSVAGSSTLRTQVLDGAPADVVALASPRLMDDLVREGALATPPTTFATNHLVLAVAPGNPAGIDGLDDLAATEPYVGLCDPAVPCGQVADETLAAAGITPSADSREPNVRALLAKVESGELDAGLVYATDLVAAPTVEGITLDERLPTATTYPVAVVAGGPEPEAAEAFVSFLTSGPAREILTRHGFGSP